MATSRWNWRIVVVAGSSLAASAAAGQSEAPGPERAAVIEEIVVKGQKRDTTLLELAGSAAILSAEELERDAILDIEDLYQKAVNFNFLEYGDGQYRLSYRGIGATGPSDNQNFNVAIDDVIVPYGRAFRLLDLADVEVHLGPQGTTYGRNASAGVVAIHTNDGSAAEPSSVMASYAEAETLVTSFATGGRPRDGSLFFRVAGRYRQSDGFHENRLRGDPHSAEQQDYTLRVTSGYDREPDRIKLSYTHDDYDNKACNLSKVQTPYQCNTKPNQRDLGIGSLHMPMLTAQRNIGDLMEAKIIGAYARSRRYVEFGVEDLPPYFVQIENLDSYTAEFRLTSITPILGGAVDWQLGFAYLDELQDYSNDLDVYDLADFIAGDPNNPDTPPTITPIIFQAQDKRSRVAALFGGVNWHPWSWLRFDLGGRVSSEWQRFAYLVRDSQGELQLVSGTFLPPNLLPEEVDPSEPEETRGRGKEHFLDFSPKAAVTWFPNDVSSLYLSVAKGFRSGSFNVQNLQVDPENGAFDSEITWQAELGYKLRFFDGRGDFRAAVFYIDWTDLQVQTTIAAGEVVVDNAADARSVGFETRLEWMFVPQLIGTVQYGLTDARYQDFVTANGNDVGGNRVEGSPRDTVSVALDFDSDMGFLAGVDLARYGSTNWDAGEIPDFEQDPYVLMNARIGYRIEKLYGLDNLVFTVRGKNLTDEVYASRGVGAIDVEDHYGYFADPRNFGVDVNFEF